MHRCAARAATVPGALQLAPGAFSMRAVLGGKPSHPLVQDRAPDDRWAGRGQALSAWCRGSTRR